MFAINRRPTGVQISLLVVFLIPTFFCNASFAQTKDYPVKAIKLLVGTPPGGLADLGTRAWSDEFSKRLGVPVVVSNEGSGMLALISASNATPDGYTLLSGAQSSSIIGPAMYPKLPYPSMKNFIPIGNYGVTPGLIAVNSSSHFKTIEDLLDYAKNNPGKLNGGSPGFGTASHLSLEILKFYKRVDIVHVPFKGGAALTTALKGGHVDFINIVLPSVRGDLKAGRVRALAISSRVKEFPDIPLYSETGLAQGALSSSWLGLLAPASIPRDVSMRLVKTFAEMMNDPHVIENIKRSGFEPQYLGPDALGKLMEEDFETVSGIVKRAGIKADR